MAGLSNIFNSGNDGSDNSSNEHSNDSNFVGDANSALGLDATNSNQQSSTDEDGNTQQSSSDQALGLNTSTDGLLHSVTDSFDSSHADSTNN